jgi:hypothetical protein
LFASYFLLLLFSLRRSGRLTSIVPVKASTRIRPKQQSTVAKQENLRSYAFDAAPSGGIVAVIPGRVAFNEDVEMEYGAVNADASAEPSGGSPAQTNVLSSEDNEVNAEEGEEDEAGEDDGADLDEEEERRRRTRKPRYHKYPEDSDPHKVYALLVKPPEAKARKKKVRKVRTIQNVGEPNPRGESVQSVIEEALEVIDENDDEEDTEDEDVEDRGVCHLSRISLVSNGITEKGSKVLAVSLSSNRFLTYLNISNNRVGMLSF